MFFTDRTLATRLEAAQTWRGVYYALAHGLLEPASQSTVLAVAGGQVIYSGHGLPVNRAIGLGMDAPFTAEEIDSIEEFFGSRGERPQIDLCPLADESLLALLQERNYRIARFANVLVCPLPQPVPPTVSLGAAEVRLAKPDEAELWLRVVAQGFTGSEMPPEADLRILAPNFYSQNALCFFAWLDGEPAGGGAMYIHNGVAEFGGASTRVAYRRRGVQMALLYHRLAAAYAAGCDLALVVTEPGSASQKNVERAGFRLAYSKTIMELGVGSKA
jgi:GNAT superfamily N-acetyltransferase